MAAVLKGDSCDSLESSFLTATGAPEIDGPDGGRETSFFPVELYF
jgi:hypothetical protein